MITPPKCLLLFFCSFLTAAGMLKAQVPFGDSLSIKAEATVQASPALITITWPADADATNFLVYRKARGATSWGAALATLPAATTSYTDNGVAANTLYDYKIQMTSATSPDKYGYLSSGIDVVANSNRGIAIVVIENSYLGSPAYQDAVNQFMDDLDRDGWYAKPLYVNAADAVTDVKNDIVALYDEDQANTRLLVLLGHVPVPYSGNLNPDGHPDHQGAWPTDIYYADINGNWTDASVNNASSPYPANQNVPGDGKFDQSSLPSDADLEVGRVDLNNLPVYGASEEELLLGYLSKAHAFKSGEIIVGEQALIDDNFTAYDEGFSQNGYNNFAALVGRSNTYTNDYFGQLSYTTSTTGTYLWSYGCGAGNFTGASGIGSSSTFAGDSLSSVFTMLFGSYFGDWDNTNAFLRAPLGQGNTLTNCWAGRPNWYFNHMAMGENIGYSTRLSQNNSTLYFSSTISGLYRLVSTNLMGDPSLRMHYPVPPTNLVIDEGGFYNTLTWSPGSGEDGYNIYRRYADSTEFVKLNPSLVTGTTFMDGTITGPGLVYYYVKAVELKTTPSGTYECESLGAKDSAVSTVGLVAVDPVALTLYPNPARDFIQVDVLPSLTRTGFEILDAKGAVILSGSLNGGSNRIDVSSFSNGAYSIRMAVPGSEAVVFIVHNR